MQFKLAFGCAGEKLALRPQAKMKKIGRKVAGGAHADTL